jgi:uncharacterized protein (DUF305 family)
VSNQQIHYRESEPPRDETQPGETGPSGPGKPIVLVLVSVVVALLALAVIIASVGLAQHRAGPTSSRMMGGGVGGPVSEQEFLLEMIAHHQEAIAAAGELRRSDRVEMRELGAGIVTGQTAEVRQMQEWLASWYPGDVPRIDYQPEMRPLSELEGDRLDETFLVDMVRHHMMAVMMARQLLFSHAARHQEVEDLARSIVTSQSEEIVRMQTWLQDWFDRPAMMPGWVPMGPEMGHGRGESPLDSRVESELPESELPSP